MLDTFQSFVLLFSCWVREKRVVGMMTFMMFIAEMFARPTKAEKAQMIAVAW